MQAEVAGGGQVRKVVDTGPGGLDFIRWCKGREGTEGLGRRRAGCPLGFGRSSRGLRVPDG